MGLRLLPLDLARKVIGWHVVTGAPEHADIDEAEAARAGIRKRDEPRVAIAHPDGNAVPSPPGVEQLRRITTGRQDALDVCDLQTMIRRLAVLPAPVIGLETARDTA